VPTDRRAIVLAGPPGAGKSTVLAAVIASTETSVDDWRIINSDDFKDLLLEHALRDGSYDSWILQGPLGELHRSGERLWPRELAALVHEEAGVLVDVAIDAAIRAGENIVIDGTLSQPAKAHELLERLSAAGYTVQIVDVEAAHHVVQGRVAARWRADYLAAEAGTSDEPAVAQLGGRWVPSEVVHELFASDDAQVSVCADVAREVAERHRAVREYALYRVSDPAGAPELVEQRGRVRESALLDAETYRAARAADAARPRSQPTWPPRRRDDPHRGADRS
jgi:predicted kinase